MATDEMTLVARRGEELYLLQNGEQGIVVDTEDVVRFAPRPIESILRRGYWDRVKHNDDIAEMLMLVPEEKSPAVIKAHMCASEYAGLSRKSLNGKIARTLVKAARRAHVERVQAQFAKQLVPFFMESQKYIASKVKEDSTDLSYINLKPLDKRLARTVAQPMLEAFGEGAAAEMRLRKAVERVKGYNPDQPRDELGRWGSGGGAENSDDGGSDVDAQVDSLRAVGDDKSNAWNPLLPPGVGSGDDVLAAEDAIQDILSELPPEAVEFITTAPKDSPGDIRQVPIKWIVTQQATVDREIMRRYLSEPVVKEHGVGVKIGTKVVLIDGNHRVAAEKLKGKTTANIRIVADFRRDGSRITGDEYKSIEVKASTASDFADDAEDEIDFPTEFPEWLIAAAEAFLDDTFSESYWTDINITTRDHIEVILREGVRDGLSMREIRDRIMEDAPEYSRSRAMNVARTETGGALNAGQVAAMEESGVDGKEWLSVLGSTTRDTHAEADGQQRGLDENFEVGGEECRWPGDTSLPPGERCNCQCTVVSSFVGQALDEEGDGDVNLGDES